VVLRCNPHKSPTVERFGESLLVREACKCLRVRLPIVDAFRTFAACPPPALRAVFQDIQTLMAP
jgi:hypothetical protein